MTLVNAHTSVPCPILPCLPLYVKMWLKRISCLFMYCSYVSIGHADMLLTYSAFVVPVFNIIVANYSVCRVRFLLLLLNLHFLLSYLSSIATVTYLTHQSAVCLHTLLIQPPCINLYFHFFFKNPTYFSPTCLKSLSMSLLSDVVKSCIK